MQTGIPISLLFTIIGILILSIAGGFWFIFWRKFSKVEGDIIELQANKSSRQHIDQEIGHMKELMNLRFQCVDTELQSIHGKSDFIISTLTQKGKK